MQAEEGSLQETLRPSGSPDRQGAGEIRALSEEDIRRLVVEKKWMGAIMSSCMEEMQQVTQQLSAAITAVSVRYERTLPSLEADAHRYEDEVNGYLKEMGFIL